MTEKAIDTIRRLETATEVPGAGLRIASNPADGSLTLTMTAAPALGDEVVTDSGVRVFLDDSAAALLADKTMDATTNPEGRVQFTFTEGPG